MNNVPCMFTSIMCCSCSLLNHSRILVHEFITELPSRTSHQSTIIPLYFINVDLIKFFFSRRKIVIDTKKLLTHTSILYHCGLSTKYILTSTTLKVNKSLFLKKKSNSSKMEPAWVVYGPGGVHVGGFSVASWVMMSRL